MSEIQIIKQSITNIKVDAIVNAANEGLWHGGGVCGYIFDAAGPKELSEACAKIGHCDTGKAVITPGFKCKSKYIIHAVGPVWHGGRQNEPELLYSCYKESLKLAKENNCQTIAFPLISAGIFGYPKEKAWNQAIQACLDFLKDNEMTIYFTILDCSILEMGNKILKEKIED